MKKPLCVDAFCGAGGLSLGLTAAGFDVIYGFDIDGTSIQTLKNNPAYIKHDVEQADIRDLLDGRLLHKLNLDIGDLDLLAGGPPCQGFSAQRTIGGDQDSRNLLVDEYAKLIHELMPRFFLLENVLGLGGQRGKETLDRFKHQMAALNYHPHEMVLNAADFGVPQRRKRIIVVGERLNGDPPLFSFPTPANQRRSTVRDVIAHLPAPPDGGADHPQFPGHRADKLSEKNKARLRALKAGQARTHLPEELLANCHRVSADVIGHRNVYGRMAWDDVAPTITARFDSFTRGKFGHPEQVRTISLYEGALLQTFPGRYNFSGSKVEIARQIGNAVPPQMACTLGRQIAMALKAEALHK